MSDAWMLVQPGNSSAAALRSSVVQTYYEVSCGQFVLRMPTGRPGRAEAAQDRVARVRLLDGARHADCPAGGQVRALLDCKSNSHCMYMRNTKAFGKHLVVRRRFMDGSVDSLDAIVYRQPQQGSAAQTAATPAEGGKCLQRTPLGHRLVRISLEILQLASCVRCAGADTTSVDVQHANDLSYEEFVCRYMAPNVPVVIQASS